MSAACRVQGALAFRSTKPRPRLFFSDRRRGSNNEEMAVVQQQQIQQGQLYNLRPKLASTNAVNAPAMAEADALALVFYPV